MEKGTRILKGRPELRFLMAFLLISFTLGITSCLKDNFEFDKMTDPPNWKPDVAAPLINSHLTLVDFIKNADSNHLIAEPGTGFLYLIYEGVVYSNPASILLPIPNQNPGTNHTFNTGAIAVGDSTTVNYSDQYSWNMYSGEILDSMRIKSGVMNFSIMSDLNHPARIELAIPDATINGFPFRRVINYIPGMSPVLQSFDLSGYTFEFSQMGAPNIINLNYKITVYGDGNPDNSPYSISMNETMVNIFFSNIFGDLGEINTGLSADTVHMKIFNNHIDGNMNFTDPRMYFNVYNSFGLPINTTYSNFHGYAYSENPPVIPLTTSPGILPNPISVAAVPYSQIGSEVMQGVYLDNSNSNLDNVLSFEPKFFICDVVSSVNPGGSVTNGFATDTSRVGLEMKVELPLYGSADDFVFNDTVDFEFGESENIEFIVINIDITNGFPVDGDIQLFFADSNYTILDSLLNPFERVMQAAPVGPPPDYKVNGYVQKITSTTLPKSTILKLADTKYMILRSKLNTILDNGQTVDVKFYEDYFMDIKLSARAKFKVEF